MPIPSGQMRSSASSVAQATREQRVRTWTLYPPGTPGSEHNLTARVLHDGPETGVPVVFLHGLVGLNEHWEDLVDKIKHRARCLCLELPLLQTPAHDCSIEGITRLTERFLREEVGEPVVLVGNSFGGHVALRLAIQQPQMLKGLVLAGSSGLIEKSIVSTVEIRPTRGWLHAKIAELYFDPSNVREQDVDRAFAALSQRGSVRAMVKLSRSARRDVLRGQVGQIKAPTLLVWGKQDVVTPPKAAVSFAELIPGSKLVWIDKCGHVPMAEGAEVFASAMHAFLDALGTGA